MGILSLLLLSVLVALASAHSWMTKPYAFNQVFHTKSCKGEECSNACPNIRSDESDMHNTAEKPAAVWKRGEKVMFGWAKNNHRGGLVRVSLVPADNMMSRPWHAKLTLFHGCWESGMYRCSGMLCGSDSDNEGFQREFVIPSVFPDGIYVAAVVWYGGLHYSRDRGQFPDYFSCSFVHIKGGAPLGGSYQPVWAPGDTGKFEAVAYTGDSSKEGMCQTASDEVGKCPKTGCTGPAFWAVSKPYQNGRMPDKITPRLVAEAFKERPLMNIQDDGGSDSRESEPVSLPEPPTEPEPEAETNSDPEPEAETNSDPEPEAETNSDPEPETETETDSDPNSVTEKGDDPETETEPVSAEDVPAFAGAEAGICSGSVCCPTMCGSCGGSDCHKRPGGGENCCHSRIKRSGRRCSDGPPPCVRD